MTETIPEVQEAKQFSNEHAATAPPENKWERIKEHKVLQSGLAYLGAALALAHGADLLGHAFHWPEALDRLILGLLIVGFPVAIALAWYHGHRGLRAITTGEATIISILVVIGAGLLVLFVRPPMEKAEDAATPPARSSAPFAKAPAHAGSGSSDAVPSIAVLPFVNMSSDREQEYFSDGLSEELLNELAQVPNLRVIGRTSSFAFKGKNQDLRTIGETLGVDHILEGSVRKSGDRLRITAQLIDPADGSHLWSGTYDHAVGDVFEIQQDIAQTVASALRVSIEATNLNAGGTRNLEAYDAFLRASPYGQARESIVHLERAVQLDPQFTQGWEKLAGAYGNATLWVPDRAAEFLQKGRGAQDRVIALAPNSAATKVMLATREIDAGHLLQAERLLESALTLATSATVDPKVSYSTFLLDVGRARDALPIVQAAEQADPVSEETQTMLLLNYETLGDYTQAEIQYRRAIAVLPGDDVIEISAVLRAMGRQDAAAVRKALAVIDLAPLDGTDRQLNLNQINPAMLALLDKPVVALAILRRWSIDPDSASQPLSLIVAANWAAYFGDAELSLQLLRVVLRRESFVRQGLMFSLWRPIERKVRRLPGFKDLVRELGLVDYWRTSGKWGDFCHPVGQSDFVCD